MRGAGTIAAREFAALFRVPVGWVVLAAFALLTGLVFSVTALEPGTPATMRGVFGASTLLVVLVAPAVSMRLVSEELRTGTFESVLSAAPGGWSIAAGKYAAAMGFLALLMIPMLAQALVLRAVSEPAPDWGPIVAGMLSLVLLGSVCVSLGLLCSSLTESQTLAFLGTLLVLVGWLLATSLGPGYAPEPLRGWLGWASMSRRIDDFARGVIDAGHVVFFLSLSAWFVLTAGTVLEARRWR